MKESLNIQIDAEVKEVLRKMAADENRSMAQQVEYLIRREKMRADFLKKREGKE
jgi:hypothetical protein